MQPLAASNMALPNGLITCDNADTDVARPGAYYIKQVTHSRFGLVIALLQEQKHTALAAT